MSTASTRQKNLMDQHQQRDITIPTVNDPQTNMHDRQQQHLLKPVLDLHENAAPPRMMPKSASNQALPTKKRGVLNRFESAPQDGWKMIKKWVGNYRQQSKKQQLQSIASIERQAEYNTLGPLLMAMHFSRDEDGKKRIPVLLDNLTVKVTKLETKKKGTVFNIRVQYGTGANKVTWSVYRRYWDFVKLHYRYKKKYNTTSNNRRAAAGEGYIASRQRTKLPKFPSLPRNHFRKQRKRDFERGPISRQETSISLDTSEYATNPASLMDEDAVMAIAAPIAEEDEFVVVSRNSASQRPSAAHIPGPLAGESTTSMSQIMDVVKADRNVLQAFETYLNQFIASIGPLGYVNRLCKFLEISALGLALAAKYPSSYHHGKEGFVVFQSRTDRDPKQSRKLLQDGLVCSVPTTGGRRRRKPKWFVVRESYVACVDDPSECTVYDVFLFDQLFDIHRLAIFGDKSTHHLSKGGRKKFSNALANASHWASGKSTLCLKNMQGIYHFRAKNEQQAKQFEASINLMAENSIWCKENRFKSFAPVRDNTAVTWFVDGRDYFWDVSVALENAKESIYIHDWWLSPELFLRRPAANNLEWRLDRLLRRKADQGVKVYIVMYKEVAMALPLFSHQAKRHLLSLSPNIFVQRHPSRALDIFNKNSIFFWAHHEKICVVDNEVAFIGGLDKCFGRYDTPGHILVDDLKPELDPTNNHPQVWPGKDYSNPRIIDFHTLDKPFEDNQDRTKLPRMPWHDVSMRLVGPAARDVSRHFVQRWNFLRRKKPSAPKRPTPMLLPVPDDYTNSLTIDDPRICHPHTSEKCKVQILRSVSSWSIGSINDHVEHSIQTAYCESIKHSKHLIYIENQFFVTSTKSGNTVIANSIGEAIYQRVLRAHNEGTKWRAIIIVPLVPGFPANIDETEASTVRLIMQCQYLSIARGPDSILARLHAAGVTNTHEYINFYGLRNWAELNGQYVTEQVYIHAKTMIVDDMAVIIGSANINERSQLGARDSEIAAYIQDDKDLIDSYFGGKKVKVGRYAHSLRMRLMCEHVGLDVDQIDREKYEPKKKKTSKSYMKQRLWADRHLHDEDKNDAVNCLPPFIQVNKNLDKNTREKDQIQQEEKSEPPMSEIERTSTRLSSDSSATSSSNNSDVAEQKKYGRRMKRRLLRRKSSGQHIKQEKAGQAAAAANAIAGSKRLSPGPTPLEPVQSTKTQDSANTTSSSTGGNTSILSPTKSIFNKHKSTKEDYLDFWISLDPDTDNNGDRKAWDEKRNTGEPKSDARAAKDLPYEPESNYYSSVKLEPLDTGKKTVGDIYRLLQDPLTDEFQDFWHMLARINTDLFRRSFLVTPDNNVRTWDQYHHFIKMAKMFLGRTDAKHGGTKTTAAAANVTTLPLNEANGGQDTIREIIRHIRGHLVIWPNHFMEDDDGQNEFLFNVDKIAPLEIFD
ncbi:uncharacterized protein ATC70_005578 [Mucor velutinosus]|uniref:Phospholipase n=1 Tax=Mucor velutinosus TaxID=708070 RepID=A0AAN7HLS5_9FUNG|nr:hypothetical protein ATC70_005578 [Mucor velutinosus]